MRLALAPWRFEELDGERVGDGQDAGEQVLAARDLVAEPAGDALGVLERPLEARLHAEAVMAQRHAGAGQALLRQDAIARDAQVAQYVRGEPVMGGQQAQEEVFGADVVVAEFMGLLAGVVERLARARCPAPGPRARLRGRRAVALLRRLLAGAEQLADLRPGQAGGARVGDEPLDQRVAGLVELAAELNRGEQPIRGRPLGRAACASAASSSTLGSSPCSMRSTLG
jgi:hypothetical protein